MEFALAATAENILNCESSSTTQNAEGRIKKVEKGKPAFPEPFSHKAENCG